jgi:phosphopentomutase
VHDRPQPSRPVAHRPRHRAAVRRRDQASFRRTANRRDYSVPPPAPTLLDRASAEGRAVVSIGKTADIFAHRGTGEVVKGHGNDALFERTLEAAARLPEGGLLFANYVDFDTEFGHRRDVPGYADALERFDRRLPELLGLLRPDDLLVVTADHGCDPTWRGSDHTREQVPVLAVGGGLEPGSMGRRRTYADVAATVSRHLGLPPPRAGTDFGRESVPDATGACHV